MGHISSISKPKEGGTASFGCTAETGDRPLNFKWFKDGEIIYKTETIRIEQLTRDSSLLVIDPISVKHNGNYSCLISNNYGQDSTSILIGIEGNSFFFYQLKKFN